MASVAAFYERAFGTREVHRAIVPARDQPEGLFHFGVAIDDVESAVADAVAAGARASDEELPRDGRFTERYVTDPAGNRIDITRGWKVEP
jgi:hypothetical protein